MWLICAPLNIQGHGNTFKKHALKRLVEIHKLGVMLIHETVLEDSKVVRDLGKMKRDW